MNKNNAALRARVESLAPWFHNIELDGIATAPDHFLHDYPANKFSTFADVLPSNLQGKSVLDIGCNAGFYSLEMKRRGASRVVAIDSDPRYLAQAELVAEVYDADIEFRDVRLRCCGTGRTLRPGAVHGRSLPFASPAARACSYSLSCREGSYAVPLNAAGQH